MMKGDENALPVLDWVYFGLCQSEEGNNVYTYGMTAFGKEEMEILGSKHGLTESDVTLHEGETLGVSKEQKLPIIRSKGVSVEGMTLKIEY